MSETTLPDWTGDNDVKQIEIGNLCAQVVRCPSGQNVWFALVARTDRRDGWLFRSADHQGSIIGEDMARSICEMAIKLALRAEAAEENLGGLLESSCKLGTSAENAVLAMLKRAKAAEKRVRGLLCESCLGGDPLSDDGSMHVDGGQAWKCEAYKDDQE